MTEERLYGIARSMEQPNAAVEDEDATGKLI